MSEENQVAAAAKEEVIDVPVAEATDEAALLAKHFPEEAPKAEAKPAEEVKPEPAAEAKPDAETPKVEEPKKVEAETPEDKKVSARIAELARRTSSFEKQRRQFEQEKLQHAQQLRQYQEALQQLKQDPVKALVAMGLQHEDAERHLLDYYQNAKTDPVVRQMQQEMAALKRQAAESAAQAAQAQVAEQIRQYKAEIAGAIKAGGDRFALIQAMGREEDVFQAAAEYYRQNGEVASTEDVADALEAYLEQQLERAVGTEKWKKRGQSAAPQKKPAETKEQGSRGTEEKTPRTLAAVKAGSSSNSRTHHADPEEGFAEFLQRQSS